VESSGADIALIVRCNGVLEPGRCSNACSRRVWLPAAEFVQPRSTPHSQPEATKHMLRNLKLRVMASHHDSVPPLPSSSSPALTFQVLALQGRARTALMTLPHFTAETPMFMPVGTQGSVKGITCDQMLDLDCHVILGGSGCNLGQRQPGVQFGSVHHCT
jgi:hypothetical protein